MTVPALADQIDKDIKFLQVYMENGGDGIAACQAAGMLNKQYSVEATARRQLERPEIAFAIRVLQDKKRLPELPPATREEAATRAQTLINLAIGAGNLTAANVASRYQSDLLQFLDKSVTINIKHDVKTMTTAELEAFMAKALVVDAEFTEVPAIEQVLE